MKIANRMEQLSPSLTLAITALGRELKAQGKDILSFSAGEPDFDTPQIVKDAAIKAINEGQTKYTAVEGIIKTKQAIINKLKKDHNLDYKLEGIVISNGAKHSLFNLCQVLIENGDEVIIPSPYWVTYPEQVKYSGGVPVFIETDESTNFKITPEQLKKAITPKTKILMLNTPSNPTGSIYSKEELTAIGKVLEGTDIIVFSDEMYEKIIFNGKKFTAAAEVSADMYNRTVTINGLSKAVAMTGWRFGYVATPNVALAKAMTKLQGQVTSNINTMTQYAAIPALEGEADKDIEMMRAEFEKRKDYIVKAINEIDGLSCYEPDGAFYVFINIKKISNDSMKFCADLLEQKGVALVPGLAFGMEGYARFSFATSLEVIKEGVKRIKEFTQK
ncbi:pyridoxal phosphate-dependent aminotransferase [Aliarcobacter butzleri]|uniref:Aspartate aminotransferase, aminotransferase, classes I and II n=2 Tax=Aliarcobacter butzleri TaxID=28197 RepID=A8ETB1_ALIB4|nr:pyridoxal phosphate-dependent aminotransferase [Aliarcobacter butzleri]ABV67185.1 aspartate aminotransferase, aminotransferase, classes I and II [Aliarcobacter butzleri RM4018]KLE03490.1 aspartate aminotransferase [Aliarcobacter butzleri L353]MBF7065027.1 pyridoxal phosphate-dependent aminotransferase [Aliarcobacter butzleri]MCG3657730.1 pyridoxal phosphate-dependent aminotransferase [Aliarcobacter butzleri]MCG3662369.1 pyridoxal phosphate-dependent aminotransferase [Aliarcobacter butzleri]